MCRSAHDRQTCGHCSRTRRAIFDSGPLGQEDCQQQQQQQALRASITASGSNSRLGAAGSVAVSEVRRSAVPSSAAQFVSSMCYAILLLGVLRAHLRFRRTRLCLLDLLQ